jgi:hypothetical protein
MENNAVLAEMNQKFGGNYLNEETLTARAGAQGFSTAVIGKLGPTRIQDSTAAADGSQTLILDDNTGHEGGLALPSWFSREMKQAFLAPEAPINTVPNIEQEVWLMKATTRIVLPHFKESGKPFALLFWSRDPDFSQHNTKDSWANTSRHQRAFGKAGTAMPTPLGRIAGGVEEQGLDKTTDVFVTADHGFHRQPRKPTSLSANSEDRNGTSWRRTWQSPPARPSHGRALGDPANPDVIVTAMAAPT